MGVGEVGRAAMILLKSYRILIYSGPVIWNNLPDCLKNLETVDSFHRHCIKWMKSSLSFNL